MRPAKPRLKPLAPSEWSPEQRALLEPIAQKGTVWNVFSTLARHTALFKRWIPFANHVLFKQTLSPRDREILILRIGWLCRAPYEWTQHVQIALRSGISEAEIDQIADGSEAKGWNEHDAALVRAAEELHRECCLSDATWNTLSKRYTMEQMVDVVFTVGQYNLVSMALNTFGVELDAALPRARRVPD